MARDRLLIISAVAPLPVVSGGASRVWHQLEALSQQFELDLIYFHPAEQDQTDNLDKLKSVCQQVKALPLLPYRLEPVFARGIPYWFTACYQAELYLAVADWLRRRRYLAVQVEFSQLLFLLPDLPDHLPKIFVAHDIASVSFQRRLGQVPDRLHRLLHWLTYQQIKRYEHNYLPSADWIVAMSEHDKQVLQHKFAVLPDQLTVVPNGFPADLLAAKPGQKQRPSSTTRLGFIGGFSHSPNKQAVEYFFRQIYPLIKPESWQFYLAGNNQAPDLAGYQTYPEFVNLGRVEQVQDFFDQIDVLVAPIWAGSGTRIKILEASAAGKLVLTTPIGAEGLDLDKLPNVVLCTTAQEFADQINQLTNREKSDYALPDRDYLAGFGWPAVFQRYADWLVAKLKHSHEDH